MDYSKRAFEEIRDILEAQVDHLTLHGILWDPAKGQEDCTVQWRVFPTDKNQTIVDFTPELLTKLRKAMKKMEKAWGL